VAVQAEVDVALAVRALTLLSLHEGQGFLVFIGGDIDFIDMVKALEGRVWVAAYKESLA